MFPYGVFGSPWQRKSQYTQSPDWRIQFFINIYQSPIICQLDNSAVKVSTNLCVSIQILPTDQLFHLFE